MTSRFLQRWPYATIALLLSLTGLIQSCARADPQKVLTTYQVADQGRFPLHYQEAGSKGKPLVVLIHGTPGSSQAFQHLLHHPALQACCHLIAVDRLGFGESAGSGAQADFDVQASAIAQVFSQNRSNSPILIVGHSLGGSIAVKVAIKSPDQIGALLIISSALDPKLSDTRWYQRLADLPIIKQLIPDELHRANEEMLTLKSSLEEMTDDWDSLSIPVTIIQGGKDRLVPQENPAFAEQRLDATQLKVHRLPKDGHFILWERPDFIVEEILKLLQAMANQPT